jgi:alkanesulfonate monooxygenase SsuD/methylene tetrahydromethanopterin reductase-like flavin-dependent oxidoreductase (luciferase family)
VSELLGHAHLADEAGLDVVSVSYHPYFAEGLDAYAALGFILGATSNTTGAVIMTNLLSRPAPILARTVTGLSTISGGRVVLGIGAGGMWEEIVALGVPRLSPAARVRALEEAIMVVRALSGGGDPVTFDGEFYQVTELTPADVPTPPIWIGSLGPKNLAVTGRHADGWIPGHLADRRSTQVAESRTIVDEAATSVGRDPADVHTIYNVSGRFTRDPLSETRDDEGRWVGGALGQWVEELTFAVLEHSAGAFIYLIAPGDSIRETTLISGHTKLSPPSARQSPNPNLVRKGHPRTGTRCTRAASVRDPRQNHPSGRCARHRIWHCPRTARSHVVV